MSMMRDRVVLSKLQFQVEKEVQDIDACDKAHKLTAAYGSSKPQVLRRNENGEIVDRGDSSSFLFGLSEE